MSIRSFFSCFVVLVTIALSSCSRQTQTLICVETETGWGYIDLKGNFVIPPTFDAATPFIDGMALVQVGKKYGYINEKGKYELEPQYEYAVPFNHGVAVVSERHSRAKLINKQGKTIRELRDFGYIHMFTSDGVALVTSFKEHGEYLQRGYINTKGKLIVDTLYDKASDFNEGYAVVLDKAKNQVLILGTNGKVKAKAEVEAKDVNKVFCFSDGLARIEYKNGLNVFINKSGKSVNTITSDVVSFTEGLAETAMERNATGFIDKKGKIIIQPNYKEAGPFLEGLAPVSIDGVIFGFINKKGEIVVHPQYDDVTTFNGGIAAVSYKDLWGLINKKGEYLIMPKFESITLFLNQVANFPFEDEDNDWPTVINFNREISPLPDEYAWLIKGGEWRDNPAGYDGCDRLTFHEDMTYEMLNGESDEVMNGTFQLYSNKLLELEDEDWNTTYVTLDLKKELVQYGKNWFCAKNGSKYDEIENNTLSPKGVFYKSGQKGVYLHSNNGKTIEIGQYDEPEDNDLIPEEFIYENKPVRSIVLHIRNGNQFYDQSGTLVATGRKTDWRYSDEFVLTGNGDAWFLGAYNNQ